MIKLLVDSSADCPDFVINDELVSILPLCINFGEKEYIDRVTITPTEFFQKLTEEKTAPKTSQVTPATFLEVFKRELAGGDQLVCLLIASAASGTFQSAVVAKNELDSDDILLIDSNMLCLGEAYLAIKILEWIKAGKNLTEIADLAKPYTENKIQHLFTVDTMEYLKRGGRITGAKAFMAELLNIKPVLTVENGLTKPIGKLRGRKKVIPYYIKYIQEEMDWQQTDFILIGHTVDPDFAKELEEKIREEVKWEKPIHIAEIGPTIGTHCGPGVLAVFYVKK